MPEMKQISLTLPARLNSLPLLGEQLRQYLAPLHLPENWIFMLDLALCEAATNIIRHGYEQNLGRSYVVTFIVRDGMAIVSLRDEGEAIPAQRLADAAREFSPEAGTLEQLSESGRGLRLIYDCVDEVSYSQERQENVLTLIKRLPLAP